MVSSNDKLLRYDTLKAGDVEDLESNQSALAGYRNQVENLEAPQEHEDQYGAFSRGIGELCEASEIAYLLVADPVSATQADFNSYNDHIAPATSRQELIFGRGLAHRSLLLAGVAEDRTPPRGF